MLFTVDDSQGACIMRAIPLDGSCRVVERVILEGRDCSAGDLCLTFRRESPGTREEHGVGKTRPASAPVMAILSQLCQPETRGSDNDCVFCRSLPIDA